jgi:hypothetical protein
LWAKIFEIDVNDRRRTLVDEVLADLIVKRKRTKPSTHVIGTHLASDDKYGSLYKMLAE